ncbi:protein N-acetyltransferase-like protein [Haloferax mucosum ATCC BAA-1512]|uniref:Protein N-acetyltransferase-like protein n=1 Tax=Haloferax mucosum ATCC BAA-1512 TaxID=662479 RepID=M0II21_9EURY|nr:GNAT family protein [Haloferax mucosum]ELZ95099.1 protein N-acetyltransferase-like protein [Haloferax mucosum ATCC BAA-1512]
MPGARTASGERVTLRTAEREDIPFLQRAGANPELRYSLGNPLRNREQYEISDDRNAPDQFLVCLESDETDAVEPDDDDIRRLGQVTVADAHFKRPELGYWLIPEVHGEGYGRESVSLAIDYTFRTYDTPAIGAAAFDYNDASRGLLESLGFVEEGRQRKCIYVNGAYRDTIRYGLLREEWRGGE